MVMAVQKEGDRVCITKECPTNIEGPTLKVGGLREQKGRMGGKW